MLLFSAGVAALWSLSLVGHVLSRPLPTSSTSQQSTHSSAPLKIHVWNSQTEQPGHGLHFDALDTNARPLTNPEMEVFKSGVKELQLLLEALIVWASQPEVGESFWWKIWMGDLDPQNAIKWYYAYLRQHWSENFVYIKTDKDVQKQTDSRSMVVMANVGPGTQDPGVKTTKRRLDMFYKMIEPAGMLVLGSVFFDPDWIPNLEPWRELYKKGPNPKTPSDFGTFQSTETKADVLLSLSLRAAQLLGGVYSLEDQWIPDPKHNHDGPGERKLVKAKYDEIFLISPGKRFEDPDAHGRAARFAWLTNGGRNLPSVPKGVDESNPQTWIHEHISSWLRSHDQPVYKRQRRNSLTVPKAQSRPETDELKKMKIAKELIVNMDDAWMAFWPALETVGERKPIDWVTVIPWPIRKKTTSLSDVKKSGFEELLKDVEPYSRVSWSYAVRTFAAHFSEERWTDIVNTKKRGYSPPPKKVLDKVNEMRALLHAQPEFY